MDDVRSPATDDEAVLAALRRGDEPAFGRLVTQVPDRVVLAEESRAMIDAVIAALPPNQRLVITLRDVQGFTAEEACHLLGVSVNERAGAEP